MKYSSDHIILSVNDQIMKYIYWWSNSKYLYL
jgi:hypothetical protein